MSGQQPLGYMDHSSKISEEQCPLYKKPSFWFWIICLVHLLAWTIAPTIIRHNVPFDTIEGIVWGNQWQWGYAV